MSTKSTSKTCSKNTPKVAVQDQVSLKTFVPPEISLCIEKCAAKLSFTPWTIKKDVYPIGSSPTANAGGTVIQEFKVTITRPTDGPSVCWNAFFTASNTGPDSAEFKLKAELTQGNTLFSDSVVNVMNVLPASYINTFTGTITLPPGKSISGTVSSCYGSLSCPENGLEKLNVVLTASPVTGGNILTDVSCELLKLDSNSCVDKKCYFFTENPSCGDSVKITNLSGADASPDVDCPDLRAVALAILGNNPLSLLKLEDRDSLIRPGDVVGDATVNTLLICPECFGTKNEIVLTVQTSCTGVVDGTVIKNTACITAAIIENDDFVLSDNACDKFCDPAEVAVKIFTPVICCEIETDKSRVCVCKTSKVIQEPSAYEIKGADYYFSDPPQDLLNAFGKSRFYFERIGADYYPYCDRFKLPNPSFVPTTLTGGAESKSCSFTLPLIFPQPLSSNFSILYSAFFTSVFNLDLVPSSREYLTGDILNALCQAYILLTNALIDVGCNKDNAKLTFGEIIGIIAVLLPLTTPDYKIIPAVIEYSITPNVIEGKNVCFRFALINAAPGQIYNYEVSISDGCGQDITVSDSLQKGTVTVSTETTCEKALNSNAVIEVCVPIKDIPDYGAAILVSINGLGLPDTLDRCEAIPASEVGSLRLGECIELTCDGTAGCEECKLVFNSGSVTLIKPVGDNDETKQIRANLTELLFALLELNCQTDNYSTFVGATLTNFLNEGLHFTLALGGDGGCCGKCVVVKNTFSLAGGSISSTCTKGEHSYSTDASTYDSIKFPPCRVVVALPKTTRLTKKVVFRK